jgi:hypothetical protein
MQNKPNSRKVKNALTLVIAMTNNNEQRTANYSKQTQSNPILSASSGIHPSTNPLAKFAQIPCFFIQIARNSPLMAHECRIFCTFSRPSNPLGMAYAIVKSYPS